MDGATVGLIGGIAGSVVGLAGGVFGCWMSYSRAENDAQRAFLRRVFVWGGFGTVLFLALIFGTSTGMLPRWVYWVTMAAVFVPLGFCVRWLNRRLSELKSAAPE